MLALIAGSREGAVDDIDPLSMLLLLLLLLFPWHPGFRSSGDGATKCKKNYKLGIDTLRRSQLVQLCPSLAG